MNIQARNFLMDAFGRGTAESLCVIGVLLRAIQCPHLTLTESELTQPTYRRAHGRCKRTLMRRFALTRAEWAQLLTEYYDLGYDFLTLAWTHDPVLAGPGRSVEYSEPDP